MSLKGTGKGEGKSTGEGGLVGAERESDVYEHGNVADHDSAHVSLGLARQLVLHWP